MSHRGERNDMDIEMLQSQIDALKDDVKELRKIVDRLAPHLPWQDAPDWARYAARDVDGSWYWFEEEPDESCGYWHTDEGNVQRFTHASNIDYKYSKQCRP